MLIKIGQVVGTLDTINSFAQNNTKTWYCFSLGPRLNTHQEYLDQHGIKAYWTKFTKFTIPPPPQLVGWGEGVAFNQNFQTYQVKFLISIQNSHNSNLFEKFLSWLKPCFSRLNAFKSSFCIPDGGPFKNYISRFSSILPPPPASAKWT